MTATEFDKLAGDLRALAQGIPLHWGAVQSDGRDARLTERRFFALRTYEALEEAVGAFPDEAKAYFRRRWFLWQCARCDEYLFCLNPNVHPNPNSRDKGYDIAFDEGIRFDVKGTVIPKQMREASPSCVAGLMAHPLPIIRFYYDKQSHGRRFDMQNRLFVVHHSFVDEHRELYLRCAWRTKREAYREYARNIGRIAFREWQGCKASVLFIVERRRGVDDRWLGSFAKTFHINI